MLTSALGFQDPSHCTAGSMHAALFVHLFVLVLTRLRLGSGTTMLAPRSSFWGCQILNHQLLELLRRVHTVLRHTCICRCLHRTLQSVSLNSGGSLEMHCSAVLSSFAQKYTMGKLQHSVPMSQKSHWDPRQGAL